MRPAKVNIPLAAAAAVAAAAAAAAAADAADPEAGGEQMPARGRLGGPAAAARAARSDARTPVPVRLL